jgi:hypothetical protein
MSHVLNRVPRGLTGVAAAALLLAVATPAAADGPYYKIEEDWELVLNTPDLSFPSPQIVVAMKPRPDSTKTALFLVNHHDYPKFEAGGGQIQLWDGPAMLGAKSFAGPTLIRDGETVTWTQYLQRGDGNLKYGLSAVSGEAWGTNTADTLGGPASAPDGSYFFTNYDSSNSVQNAVITFGAERVHSLKLVAVRKYRFDGKIDTEDARQVYP